MMTEGLTSRNSVDRFRNFGAAGPHDVGERRDGALDIVKRRQKRLGGVAWRAGEERDAFALHPVVQKPHGAGMALARNAHGGDVVAQFEGQLQFGFDRGLIAGEQEGRFGELAAFFVQRNKLAGAGVRRAAGALKCDLERLRAVLGGGDSVAGEALPARARPAI